MKDKFSRHIDYLRISLTSSCNLSCGYCLKKDIKKEKDSILKVDEILKIIKVCLSLGINRFRLTGGEPLLRKDCVEIVKGISQISGVKDLSLTTNGILLSRYAIPLREAGLKRINISLDTLSQKKFLTLTKENLFSEVFSGVKEAKRAGFSPLRLNVVLMREINLDEIFDFVKLSLDSQIQIRFIELMPHSLKDKFFKRNFVSAKELRDILEQKFKLYNISQESSGPAHYYQIKEKGIIGIIAPISECFCDICNRLRLTSYGTLRLCLFSKEEVDIKHALKTNDRQLLENLIRKAILQKPEKKDGEFICGEMMKIGG